MLDVTESQELQLQRVMLQLRKKDTDFERYIYLNDLLDHNETLFYQTVMSMLRDFSPFVYDPTDMVAFIRRQIYKPKYRTEETRVGAVA